MKTYLKKNIITHAVAVLGFLIITAVIYFPLIFEGKNLKQHDSFQGSALSRYIFEHRKTTDSEPLWNNNVFSGMPGYMAGTTYHQNLLKYIHPIIRLKLPGPSYLLMLCFVSFYIMMLAFGVRPLIAFGTAIAFGLCGFNIIGFQAGHNAKIHAIAYMPLVIAGVKWAYSGKRLIGTGLFALSLGLQIRANHPQITYYLLLFLVAFGINEMINISKTREWKKFTITTVILIMAAVFGAGSNYNRLTSLYEYSKHTIRGKAELSSAKKISSSGLGKDYAFEYSFGIFEPLVLFVPNILGGSLDQKLSDRSNIAKSLQRAGYNRSQIKDQVKSAPTYWGEQRITAPFYAGTLTVLLFILGVFILSKKQKVWLVSLVVISIVLSWGKNFSTFNYLVFDYLPMYNKFRSPTFITIIIVIAMNMLGGMALEKLLKQKWNDELKKKLYWAFGIPLGFLLLLVVISGSFSYSGAIDERLPDWFLEALKADRKALLIKDSLRAFLFIGLLSAAFWLFYIQKIKLKPFLIVISLLIFVDSFLLSKRFINRDRFEYNSFQKEFALTDADEYLIDNMKMGDRVLNLNNPFNENRTSYHHASVGGYHAAKLRRYQDLISHCINSEMQKIHDDLNNKKYEFNNIPVLNMLNTRFFYWGNQRTGIIPNTQNNGPAWVINKVIAANSPDEEIVHTCSLNTKYEAVIDQSKFDIPTAIGTGTIELLEKKPNQVLYSAKIKGGKATGIFSEIYYSKDWKAYINGDEVNILRANYVLRALELPEGTHKIEFIFDPDVYKIGGKVSYACSSLTILLFLVSMITEVIKKRNSLF